VAFPLWWIDSYFFHIFLYFNVDHWYHFSLWFPPPSHRGICMYVNYNKLSYYVYVDWKLSPILRELQR
jgi:hypothetical protein